MGTETTESEGGAGSNDEPDTAPLIINELLCFATDKLNIMPPDSVNQICIAFYDLEKIIAAKDLLFSICEDLNDTKDRYIKRKGPNAAKASMDDILNMILRKQAINARFVAEKMSELPAVSFNSIDVSVLLSMMESMQTEIGILKNAMHAQAVVSEDLKEIVCTQRKPGRPTAATPNAGLNISPITSGPTLAEVLERASQQGPNTSTPKPSGMVRQLNANAKSWTSTQNQAGTSPAKKTPSPPPIPARKNLPPRPPADPDQPWETKTRRKRYTIGTGRHTIKAAAYAKEGRAADVFVTRLAPDVTVDDIIKHVKDNLNIPARVELVKATNNYCSFHINATCKMPSKLIDPDLWPEGAIVRWWRTPRPKLQNAPLNQDMVSDETLRNMTVPRISQSLAPKQVTNTENEKSVQSEEQLLSTSDLEQNPAISDKTMAEVQYEDKNHTDAQTRLPIPPQTQRSRIMTRARAREERAMTDMEVERSRSQIDLRVTGSN